LQHLHKKNMWYILDDFPASMALKPVAQCSKKDEYNFISRFSLGCPVAPNGTKTD